MEYLKKISIWTAKALSPRGSEQTPSWLADKWVGGGNAYVGRWFLYSTFLNLKKTTALHNICAINRCNQSKTWIFVCLLVRFFVCFLYFNKFCHNPNAMSGQDKQANITQQVAQSETPGDIWQSLIPLYLFMLKKRF